MVIKPTRLIKGQRMENMMDETNIRVVGINEAEAEGTKYHKYVPKFPNLSTWLT